MSIECHAHGIYYRDVAKPPEEMKATWFEQFYVEDAALVESVTNPAGKTAQMTPPMDKTPTLFRWEWITGPIASDSRPEKRPIGFLSDLRGGKKGIAVDDRDRA